MHREKWRGYYMRIRLWGEILTYQKIITILETNQDDTYRPHYAQQGRDVTATIFVSPCRMRSTSSCISSSSRDE